MHMFVYCMQTIGSETFAFDTSTSMSASLHVHCFSLCEWKEERGMHRTYTFIFA